ncbi:hypothetical protein BVC71_10600 [Marivivens niveibacter]|uniref:DUF2125 domain-containing protein n=1 Tax=Marivivens niveibacter TaxID=1930667 RepID=A0A251WXS4_9RHOB|nr:DUF2125 domain-containing protein [Marivivens niveibacter]OUD09146.1 hypothetical protein BVC71_10600 [Marivivens niveibacter]
MGARRWVVGLGIAYATVWGLGSFGYSKLATSVLIDLTANGQVTNYDGPHWMMNPLRVGSDAADLAFRQGGSIENIQISTPLLAPNHVRAKIDGAVSFGGITQIADELWIDVGFRYNPNAEIASVSGVIENAVVSGTFEGAIGSLTVDMQAADLPTYTLSVSGTKIQLPAQMINDPILRNVDLIDFDGQVTFDRVMSVTDQAPNPLQSIEFAPLQMNWGELDVTVNGDLAIDAFGIPTGRLDLSASGWQMLVQLMADAGVIDRGTVFGYSAMIGGLADENGRVNLPLIFADGQIKLGPFPLGPAPRLR